MSSWDCFLYTAFIYAFGVCKAIKDESPGYSLIELKQPKNLVLLFVIYPPLVYLLICLVASIAPYAYTPMSLVDYTYTCLFKIAFPISVFTVTNYIVYSKYDFTKFQTYQILGFRIFLGFAFIFIAGFILSMMYTNKKYLYLISGAYMLLAVFTKNPGVTIASSSDHAAMETDPKTKITDILSAK